MIQAGSAGGGGGGGGGDKNHSQLIFSQQAVQYNVMHVLHLNFSD